jgi:hypothetical protein
VNSVGAHLTVAAVAVSRWIEQARTARYRTIQIQADAHTITAAHPLPRDLRDALDRRALNCALIWPNSGPAAEAGVRAVVVVEPLPLGQLVVEQLGAVDHDAASGRQNSSASIRCDRPTLPFSRGVAGLM